MWKDALFSVCPSPSPCQGILAGLKDSRGLNGILVEIQSYSTSSQEYQVCTLFGDQLVVKQQNVFRGDNHYKSQLIKGLDYDDSDDLNSETSDFEPLPDPNHCDPLFPCSEHGNTLVSSDSHPGSLDDLMPAQSASQSSPGSIN